MRDREGQTAIDLIGRFCHIGGARSELPPDTCATETILGTVDLQNTRARDLKRKGNTAFAKEDFPKAVDFYGQALVKMGFENPKEKSILFSNRSQCHLNLKNWQAAESDARHALLQDPDNEKARFRLEKAQQETNSDNVD